MSSSEASSSWLKYVLYAIAITGAAIYAYKIVQPADDGKASLSPATAEGGEGGRTAAKNVEE